MASSPDAVRRKLTKILRQKARARRPKWWEWVPGIFGERVFGSGYVARATSGTGRVILY